MRQIIHEQRIATPVHLREFLQTPVLNASRNDGTAAGLHSEREPVGSVVCKLSMSVSATNGCAYCINSHTTALRKLGIDHETLGEIMAIVQIAMLGGIPYTAIRDAVITHPTMAEGLGELFSSMPQG